MSAPVVRSCDAEIGKPGNWRGCRRPSVWTAVYHGPAGYYSMCYCERHADRLTPMRGSAVRASEPSEVMR